MGKRTAYLLCFFALLAIEICIGAFLHDGFIRLYVGDMLVTVLLCCLVRVLQPNGCPAVPCLVFVFSALVETVQLLEIPERLGLEGTILGIALGSTFDWVDLVCYLLGCVIFFLCEHYFIRK